MWFMQALKEQKVVQRVLIIAGPTASGKSALAIAVAREFSGVIINADSMQVYKQMNILTARPPAEDLAKAEHRLYGILNVDDPCSVGRWLDLAIIEIQTAWVDGKLPIIVGGTGMYLKALLKGLAPVPKVPSKTRKKATSLHKKLGGEVFRQELAVIDPKSAIRIPAGDTQRLIRAYEVVDATGQSLSDWQKNHPSKPPLDALHGVITLLPERDILYDGVNKRFDWMMKNGAMTEVRALDDLCLDPALPAMKAVGVPELRAVISGEKDLKTAKDDAKRATRQFAKRQMTWLRNQLETDLTLSAQYSERLEADIFSFVGQFMLTKGS
jgi:tRNA dimethylallyltransferase